MCQISFILNFILLRCSVPETYTSPSEQKDLLMKPFKCDNILKFYLPVSNEAVFYISSSYNVRKVKYRPVIPNIKTFAT